MNALAETKKEIKATKRERAKVGDFFFRMLDADARATLALPIMLDTEKNSADMADAVLRVLVQLAAEKKSARAAQLAARPPLCSSRYTDVVVRGLQRVLSKRQAMHDLREPLTVREDAPAWCSVPRSVLDSAYMLGSIPAMAEHAAHPGSRNGVLVFDLRTIADYADKRGVVTPESIRARVAGEVKP